MADDSERIRPRTPPIDPLVSSLASRVQHQHSSRDAGTNHDDDENEEQEEDEEALFEELEKEDDNDILGAFRERRLEALKAELSRAKDMRESDHGRLTEILDEKEVIRTSANEDRCIIHFYHRDFRRCDVMNKHLEILAPRHFKTRFLKVFVENVPWLVEKLSIKVLPCVICFIKGVSRDRLIGFEEIGNDDAFTTTALELRLAQSGVIDTPQASSSSTSRGARNKPQTDEDDSIDWD